MLGVGAKKYTNNCSLLLKIVDDKWKTKKDSYIK